MTRRERFHVVARIGWWAGCVTGYPTKRHHRWAVVQWLTRFDPNPGP